MLRPMTKEDNAAYASRSGLVLLAGNQGTQAVDATVTAARAADKALNPEMTFVAAAREDIEYWQETGAEVNFAAVY